MEFYKTIFLGKKIIPTMITCDVGMLIEMEEKIRQ